ncbi:hypothetical protein SZ25_00313 [Candidatus Arcanobacter lacustris]|uniref:Type II secretion system protein G n=1 Tax=Candidatus Arcanibacter lacustris TaxID=1607817 RepID=A0A0F5MR92_9RICK|nr:hypothetical protein SZ25_00313 [Candidatus Arcanobacter lacustris]
MKYINYTRNSEGFTLIELSIVLVIIALLIGGIMTGRELINQAKIKGDISQIIKFNAAINTFQMKYNALPGDFAQALQFIPATNGTIINGDGNGLIGGASGSTTPLATSVNGGGMTYNTEYFNFWNHLSSLNLIEGYYPSISSYGWAVNYYPGSGGIPASISDITFGIVVVGNKADMLNYYFLSFDGYINDNFKMVRYMYTAENALNIDTKLDDGNPISGIVVARGFAGGAGSISYVDGKAIVNGLSNLGGSGCLVGTTYSSSSTRYNTIGNNSKQCALRIRVN